MREGLHGVANARVAVKCIDKAKLTEGNDRRRVGREIRVLARLRHDNVIRLFDVADTASHIFVIMEYAEGGSLLDYVRASKRLGEPESCRLFRQALAGIGYCHERGIVHRDIKLENLLLDRSRNLKIVDFGLSAILIPGKRLKVHCGSPSYAAPEIIARKVYDGPPVDIWSAGVVLFAMVAGYLPFHASGGNKNELCAKIMRGVYTAPEWLSEPLADLLRTMLMVEPARRATLQSLGQHEWVARHPAEAAFVGGELPALTDLSVDRERLKALASRGCDSAALLADLKRPDIHNYLTAAYHLWKSEGGVSREDKLPVYGSAVRRNPVFTAEA